MQTVCSLVCHSHVDMALQCLGSLIRLCNEQVRLRIHDDGTLTTDDIARLRSLGDVQIVSRREADAFAAENLKDFPECQRYRTEHPLALKLLDTVLMCDDDHYGFSDSDVLFLRRFLNPFRPESDGVSAVFMTDRQNSYCFRSWGFLLAAGVQLPAFVNTGIVGFRKSLFDLERVERFLSLKSVRAIPSMREQTCWAMLGRINGCRRFDPLQVRVMRSGENEDELVAGHFTARTRPLLTEYVRRSEAASVTAEPVRIRTVDPGVCTAGNLAMFELSRLFARLKKP